MIKNKKIFQDKMDDPLILKIVFDELPDKQKEKIDLLLSTIFISLFLLNTFLSFILFSKVYDTIINSYDLVKNYFSRNNYDLINQ